MLITLQFPISDARPFIPQLDLRLPVPDWSYLSAGFQPQFVHHFGQATTRNREPDQAWPDEITFCRARRGLRFYQLERYHVGLPQRRFKARCAFRRLFCDGQAVVRMEVGIAATRNRHSSPTPLTIGEVLSVAREIAECPTIVPNSEEQPSSKPIIAQGKFLARLFAHASMNKVNAAHVKTGMRLVESADPLILVELGNDKLVQHTDELIEQNGILKVHQDYVNGAEALFCRLKTAPGIVSLWLLQRGLATREQLRSLRICLTRLHAEREVLDLILKQIQRRRLLNPSTEEAVDLLDAYFNDHIKLINRDEWAGMNQSEITAAFDATQSVVRPASQAQLISRYEGSRRQVWKKIQKFQEERRATRLVQSITTQGGDIFVEKQINVSGTGNIVNVAEYMSNVTNTVNNNLAQSKEDTEVRDLIAELNRQVVSVAPNADPSQIQKMGKNLERLSDEAANDEPDKRWYDLSLKGIKEAAEAVGEIAGPILKTVSKLVALLL